MGPGTFRQDGEVVGIAVAVFNGLDELPNFPMRVGAT